MTEAQETITGRIERLFFSSASFSAGKLRDSSGKLCSFAGSIIAAEGENVILLGRWEKSAKWGKQFRAESMQHDLELSEKGLAEYLSNNPAFVGVGPVKAKRIAKAFGRDFSRIIVDSPETVAKEGRITLDAAMTIRSEWITRQTVNAAATELSAYGLTHHQVTTMIEKYGDNAVAILRADPFLMMGDLRGFGFKRIDTIARKIGMPRESPSRVRAGIIACLDDALDQGHCWLEESELIEKANKLLVIDRLESRTIIENELSNLLEGKRIASDAYDGRFLIARADIRSMEREVETWLRSGDRDHPCAMDLLGVWQKVRDGKLCPDLNPNQRRAVVLALSRRMVVLSGGAGSGKTYTVGALVKILQKSRIKVTLAAPTGKAAKRLEQVVGQGAYTIHRLLGFNGHQWSHGPENPIKTDVVIIDETSMVDIALAWRLLRALELEKTAVVFVGDHNQLPPVGPGDLLRDLIQTGIVPGVILTDVVRQAGELKENSIAVLRGRVAKTSAHQDEHGRRPWYRIDDLSDPYDVRRLIGDIYETILADKLRFDLIRDVQLLTPKRKDALGVDELNIELQRLIQRKLYGVDVPTIKPGRRPPFLRRDKVIQRRNNYDLGIMNGSIGIVTGTDGANLRVRFDENEVTLMRSEGHLDDLDLAYALTIHQAQGSEFPCVVVVIHKSHSFMHSQNLFYTGISRARQTAVIIGDRWGVRNCALKKANDERNTFIGLWRKDKEAVGAKEALFG